ncbi:sugar transferase [Novosphingopyxis sp. YJ-S2-01]|nr:sugar transferase [Novosphingopyxis sp. YJ-S2-01]MBH9538463.1 sugar transferase [Novosphingopyxis sp. YJ-S2-01]
MSWTKFGLWQQLLAVALAAYLLPLIAPLILFGRLTRELQSTDNTQIASTIAASTALLIFRRVTAYPGARALSFIVPAFSTTFGIAAVALLLLRVPYSGPMLLTGYVASIGFSFLLGFLDQRSQGGRFYYVPVGVMRIVEDVPDVEWIELMEPNLPRDPHAAIVADLRSNHTAAWERMLAEAAISGIPVYHTKQLRESLTGRVQIEHLSENSFGSLIPALAYRGFKRSIDVVSTILLLPLLALPLLVIALLVRFSSPGPILFRQRRMGFRGVPFDVLKFRTMKDRPPDSEGDDGRAAAITLDEDERITRVGRFLRKSRIDELPQMFNILRGEMSWIGPRPEAVALSHWYEKEIPFYRYRHIVRPGITGWAQVNQGHVAALDDVNVKLHYDFYYIKFFSFWLDVLIAIRTVGIMLTGFGAK